MLNVFALQWRTRPMNKIMVLTALALSACSTVTPTQTATPPKAAAPAPTATPTQPMPPMQEQSVPAAGVAPAASGLSDLDAMTFGCSKAGLNAAAREAAKAPTEGHYQFSYFKIISDSHHSTYEVHFKSTYHGEPDLKYCVSIYCQQGWDPRTSRTSVTLMGSAPHATGAGAAGAAHGAHCGDQPTRVRGVESKRRTKKP